MLVQYSAYLQFPGGGPASNYAVGIWLHASNRRALLFTDQTGSQSASNPLITDEDGLASFWAAPGNYEAIIGGERFHTPVDESFTDPTWPGLWIHVQESPSQIWTINHHFGIEPKVDVLVSDEVSQASVTHTDDETTVITFGSPTAGKAHLRR